jgi:hypothetical protein
VLARTSGFWPRGVQVSTDRPSTPPGLGTSAARLWRSVTAKYELRFDEARLLEEACRELDLVERLDVELRGAGLVVPGSMGQDRPNPLLSEVRAHRLVLARLLAQVGLCDEVDAEVADRLPQVQARRAARARWGPGGRRPA